MALLSTVKRAITVQNLAKATLPQVLVLKQFLPDSSYGLVFLFVLCINQTAWIVFWLFLWPSLLSPFRDLPGPRDFITVTARAWYHANPALVQDVLAQYPNQDLIPLNSFNTLLLVSSTRAAADLLVRKCYDFHKPANLTHFMRYISGDGLVMVEGDQHRIMRKATMPAFGFRSIKNLYPMMWGKANDAVRRLQEEESEVVDLSSWADRMSLDVIGSAGIGRDSPKGHDPDLEAVGDTLGDALGAKGDLGLEKILYWFLVNLFGLGLIYMLPLRMNEYYESVRRRFSSSCAAMITEKKEAIAAAKGDGEGHDDILSLLIKSGEFSDEQLKGQILTLLGAGQETTAGTILWLCYLLAKDRTLQAKVQTEVQQADLDATTDLAASLESLPYLNGAILEALRLYPAAPMTVRHAVRDTTIADRFVPERTAFVISMWASNRSREVWGEDADECRPERWISEDGKPTAATGNHYDLMTFLHGARSCIGERFAKAELRCVLAALVREFQWELAMPEEDVVPRGIITIKPANGLRLRFTALSQSKDGFS